MKKFVVFLLVFLFSFPIVAFAKTTTMYCTGNSVNERTEPSTSSKVVRQHNSGEQIKVTKLKDGWYQLINGNWMSAQYLTDKAPTKTKSSSYYMYIKGSTVNEREKPSTSSKILKTYKRGDSVKIIGTEGDWSQTTNGYIYTSLLCTFDELIDIYCDKYPDLIIVIISSQNATYYKKGEAILTSSVVTGSNDSPTPRGLFSIKVKNTNSTLMGAHVDYFIEFNNGIGIHDASWRKTFGGSIYKKNGSHGCVNAPLDFVKALYEKCSIKNTKVLII